MAESLSSHHDYWDSFYAGRVSQAVPEEPTGFAHWVRGRLRLDQPLAEFGFGNARDALWFAGQGRRVLGFDFAETAVLQAQGRADGRGLPASFFALDLYDADAVATAGTSIASATEGPAIYGRFLIHSLEDAGRLHLLDLAATVLPDGGEMYLEFRTGQDRGAQHLFGDDHFRIYLDPDDVVTEIEKRGGSVTHCESGYGLAPYKSEDPHVARVVASWST